MIRSLLTWVVQIKVRGAMSHKGAAVHDAWLGGESKALVIASTMHMRD